MNKEDCVYCQLALIKSPRTIYEDDLVKAVLVEKPTTPGHTLIIPKNHFTILEQLPDAELSRIFTISNKISTAIFESLNMHGTNLIVKNGVASGQEHAHFSAHVVPRVENDGLNFEWKTKQLGEEEMSTVELMLKSGQEEKVEKPIEIKPKEELKDDGENYLIKQLRRIP